MERNLSGLDEVLKTLVEEMDRINKKLDTIIKQNLKILSSQRKHLRGAKNNFPSFQDENLKFVPDALTLLSLPSSLRKTIITLYKLGKATAEDIAKETKRLRSVESGYANRLVRLGYVKKRRERRKIYFYTE